MENILRKVLSTGRPEALTWINVPAKLPQMIDELPPHPLFEGLDEAQRERMRQATDIRRYEPGESLFRMGDAALRFFMIRRGQVKLFRLSPGGQEKIIELFSAPSTFAEAVMFFDRQVYPVNGEALEETEVAAFPVAVFLSILEDSHSTCLRLLGILSMRLKGRLNDVDALSLQNASLRTANYLLQMVPREAIDEVTVELPYSKRNIAARLSLQPETLSRVFARLKARGLLESSGAQLRILDVQGLRDWALGE